MPSTGSGRTVRRWCWAQPPRTRTPSSAPPWPQQDAAAPPSQGPQAQGLYGHAQTPAEMCLRAPSGSGRLRHFAKIRADRADTVSVLQDSVVVEAGHLFGRRAVRSIKMDYMPSIWRSRSFPIFRGGVWAQPPQQTPRPPAQGPQAQRLHGHALRQDPRRPSGHGPASSGIA
jgi:hypothetical protein